MAKTTIKYSIIVLLLIFILMPIVVDQYKDTIFQDERYYYDDYEESEQF